MKQTFTPHLPFVFIEILGAPPGDDDNHWHACVMREVWIKGSTERRGGERCARFQLTRLPTPAQGDVPGEVLLQGEEGAAHQGEQEVTLHQQPAVVSQDGVVGKHKHHLTSHLQHSKVRLSSV